MKRLQLEEDEGNSTNDYNGVDLNIARLNGREEMKLLILLELQIAGIDTQYIEIIKKINSKGDLE